MLILQERRGIIPRFSKVLYCRFVPVQPLEVLQPCHCEEERFSATTKQSFDQLKDCFGQETASSRVRLRRTGIKSPKGTMTLAEMLPEAELVRRFIETRYTEFLQ